LLELIRFRFSFFLFSNSCAHKVFLHLLERTPEQRIDK
jgi:hypothetical protein